MACFDGKHEVLTCVGTVVAAQVGTRFPGAHLCDHFIQTCLDASMQWMQVALARYDQ
ncbi:hypothetical protein D3C81_2130940 [compost metagenome]